MNVLRRSLVLFLIMLSLHLGVQAQSTAPVPPSGPANANDWQALRSDPAYGPLPGELRGVWMHNYAKPSWAVAMRALADANLNAVFPYMMSGGIAFYRSRVLPVHPSLGQDRDFLQEAVSAGKASGVPVHARMLNLTTLFAPLQVRQKLAAEGRLAMTSTGKASEWLCPTNPANRKQQVAAALEMLSYGVAGIQFDYLRYPGSTSCFCSTCHRAFERDMHVSVKNWPLDCQSGCYRGRFADWRREQLTSLVGELSHAIRAANPRAMISAAVFLNWEDHRDTFGQDWKAWVDRGLVDFVCPMDYTTKNERFRLYVSRQKEWIAGKVPFAAGIGINADGHQFPGPRLALEQVRIAREYGAHGFVIFNYCDKLVSDYLPAFVGTITREPTTFGLGPHPKQQSGLEPVSRYD